MNARGAMLGAAGPLLTQLKQPAPRRRGVRKLPVQLNQLFWRSPAVEPREKKRRRRFHHKMRRVPQHVRKPHVSNIFAQADRVREIRIRMVFDDEMRRPSLASEPRVDAMKSALTAGYGVFALAWLLRAWLPEARYSQEGFLRTGGGSISLPAFCASATASFVAIMASSSVSL